MPGRGMGKGMDARHGWWPGAVPLWARAALVLVALALSPTQPSAAQDLAPCATTACVNTQTTAHENLLSTFPTLLGTPAGVTQLNSNLSTVVDIY